MTTPNEALDAARRKLEAGTFTPADLAELVHAIEPLTATQAAAWVAYLAPARP